MLSELIIYVFLRVVGFGIVTNVAAKPAVAGL